jgi:DnaJ-class molecular chaperone
MMHKDYYSILEIEYPSNPISIKSAYKTAAKKWHPDLNKGVDTKIQMQEVIEAYLILKDIKHKQEYDIFYEKFYSIKNQNSYTNTTNTTNNTASKSKSNNENLNRWINEAKIKARKMASEIFEESSHIVSQTFTNLIFLLGFLLLAFFVIKIISYVYWSLI